MRMMFNTPKNYIYIYILSKYIMCIFLGFDTVINTVKLNFIQFYFRGFTGKFVTNLSFGVHLCNNL
jgi:hypothetical protein